jgi:GPI mannosyltransferase 3
MIQKYKYHFLSLLPFVVTAIFSEGFLHPDEHFVTLEFLQTKISSFSRPEIFNWDFHEKIRPWLQTLTYFILYKITPFDSPFSLAFFYRLLAGILGWYSLFLLSKKNLKVMLWISWTWFVPFLMARTSSESLSTSLFFLGTYFFTKEDSKKNSLKAGLFWGLSFLIRYQMGIVIAVANLWYLKERKPLKNLSLHSLMIIAIIGIGIVIDFWGYGSWTFSPYNYLYTNLIESRASAFGTDPFWYYLTKPIMKGGVFLPLLLLYGSFTYFKKNKKSVWLPILLSFFIIHSLIPHKEVRFLTLIYIALVFLTFSQENLLNLKKKYFLYPIIIINFIMMAKASFTPAEGLLALYKEVGKSETQLFYTPSNKHGQIFQFQMPFYEVIKRNTKGFKLEQYENIPNGQTILTTNYHQYLYLNDKCSILWLNYPTWVFQFNFSNWLNRSAITALWKCD